MRNASCCHRLPCSNASPAFRLRGEDLQPVGLAAGQNKSGGQREAIIINARRAGGSFARTAARVPDRAARIAMVLMLI